MLAGDFHRLAFAFADNLYGSAKYIADAASHEVGHTLGLHHDGTSTTGYYRGQGSWAPIMGVGETHLARDVLPMQYFCPIA